MFTYSKNPKHIRLQQTLQLLARQFRKHPTKTERLLWIYLRDREYFKVIFRRQHPLYQFIVDFYCHEHKLVIEIDGDIHR